MQNTVHRFDENLAGIHLTGDKASLVKAQAAVEQALTAIKGR